MRNSGKIHSANARRGIVLTLDVAVAMMLLLVSIGAAYATYGAPSRAGFDIQLMRNYLQDSATLMSDLGYLSSAADTANGSDTSGIRTVLRATPSTVCMQVTGYGTVLGDDLTGYWKFDEDSGSILSDSSGNGYVGTISGGSSFSSIGKNGHALSLDGINGKADVGSLSLHSHNSGTVSLWAKPLQKSGTHYLFNIGGTDCDGALRMRLSANSLELAYTDRTGTPHTIYSNSSYALPSGFDHFVVTWDSAAEKILFYNNTALIANYTWSDGFRETYMEDISFGHCASSSYYNGTLDEMRLYSRALDSSEINTLYSDPSNILFVVDKPECAFSGGEVQTLTVPFVLNADQDANEYYFATLRAWVAGAGK